VLPTANASQYATSHVNRCCYVAVYKCLDLTFNLLEIVKPELFKGQMLSLLPNQQLQNDAGI